MTPTTLPTVNNIITDVVTQTNLPTENKITEEITEIKIPIFTENILENKILNVSQCLKEGKLLIKEKNICANDCKIDDIYKYQYNGNCLIICPEDTNNDTFLCKELSINKCILNEIELDNYSENREISLIAKTYTDEYSYTNNHISKFKNNDYDIIVYKNSHCIEELSLDLPKIDFGDCYNKVKDLKDIKENLTIVTQIKYYEKNHIITHSFYNPITSEKLEAEKICENNTITVKEDILFLLKEKDVNYEFLMHFLEQDIDVFNSSDPFYTDICYDYVAPGNKDITLKDRLLSIFPNISLCEKNCESKGVNFTDMTSICQCKFNDIINSDLIKDNALINNLVDEVFEIISQSNLQVLKCYKYLFKYFSKLFGGYISMIFIGIHIILSIIYFYSDLFEIKKYIFNIMDKYLSYLLKNKNKKRYNNLKVNPPKSQKSLKFVKKRKTNKLSTKFINSNIKNNKQNSHNRNMKSKITDQYSQKCDTNKNNLLLTNNSFNISKKMQKKLSS